MNRSVSKKQIKKTNQNQGGTFYETKKLLSFISGAAMTISLLPTFTLTASATATEKNITLGTAALSGYDRTDGYDYIYYGTYDNILIKWRILSMNGNDGTYKDGGGNDVASQNAMFLLSEYALKEMPYENAFGNDSDGQTYPSDWQYSDAWYWCNDTTDTNSFIYNSFTGNEKKYLLKTDKANDADNPYTNELKGDTFFFLSKSEVQSDYIQGGKTAKLLSDSGNSVEWWLRAPYGESGSYCVNTNGGLISRNGFSNCAARPAFNLDSSKILFTSAATGGKNVAVGTLSANAANTGKEYKLTLKDSTRSEFTAKTASVSNNSVRISYENAKKGENEYISAIIVNAGGDVTHYCKLANVENESGTAALDLTGVTFSGTDKIYVFNEQINGNYKTDFSSELKKISTNMSLSADAVSVYLVNDKNATLILASYAGNTLKAIKTVPIVGTANQNIEHKEFSIEQIGLDKTGADSIKAFLWTDAKNLTPLCGKQEVKLNPSAS